MPTRLLARLAKRQVRWWLVRFLYRITDILGKTQRLFQPVPSQTPAEDNIRRILVVRVDLLGDLVMTLPAIEALRARWPQAHIAVLCTPAAGEIARRCSVVDEVFTYDPNVVRSPRNWLQWRNYADLVTLVGRLRRRRFDLAFSMFGEFACLLVWASGARHRVGYAQEGYPALLTLAVPGRRYVQPFGHEVHWNERLAAAVGAPSVNVSPRLVRRAHDVAWLAALLGGASPNGYIVIAPGAQNGSAKRYLLEHWAIVANSLMESHGVRIVLSGALRELPLVQELAALLRTPPVIAAGRTDMPQLLTLLAEARLLMAGDSGPVHLAAALATPVVVVFGPTDSRIYRPFTDQATVVRTVLPCSPCYDAKTTAECRLGYRVPLCMALTPPERVLTAARHWLAAGTIHVGRNGDRGAPDPTSEVVAPLPTG